MKLNELFEDDASFSTDDTTSDETVVSVDTFENIDPDTTILNYIFEK